MMREPYWACDLNREDREGKLVLGFAASDIVRFLIETDPAKFLLAGLFFLSCAIFGLIVGSLPCSPQDLLRKITARFAEKTLESIFSVCLGSTALPLFFICLITIFARPYLIQQVEANRATQNIIDSLRFTVQARENEVNQLRKTVENIRTESSQTLDKIRVAENELDKALRERDRLQDRLRIIESKPPPTDAQNDSVFDRTDYPSCTLSNVMWQVADSISLGRLIIECNPSRFLAFRCTDGSVDIITDKYRIFRSAKFYQLRGTDSTPDQPLLARSLPNLIIYPLDRETYHYFMDAYQARLLGPRNELLELRGIKKIANEYFGRCPIIY